MKRPAVAQMNLSSAWGGMEMSTLKIARHFLKEGYPSFVITSTMSTLAQEARAAGLEVLEVSAEGHFSPLASWHLRQLLIHHRIQSVMVHQLRNLWILRPALWGIRNIRVFGFARMFLKNINKKDLLHRHLYLRLEKMITLSHVQQEALIPCLPLPRERYLTIPNGIDVERFHPRHKSAHVRKQDFGVDADEYVIGVVGRLDPQKGQIEFIEAAAHVIPLFPKTKWVIIGEETKGESNFGQVLRARVRELQLESYFVFLGHRADTPQLMASLDLFVMPSYEEAFGNVVLEAMASQVPVIATAAGGPLDILNGDWGTLVPPREVQPLAQAVKSYLLEKDKILRQGKNGREEALRCYRLEKVMAQVEALVQSATDPGAERPVAQLQ